MCESMYTHEFICQGPLTEWDREQFDGIAASFIGSTAERTTVEIFREPGAPMTTEFAAIMAYDDDGNDEIITPILLDGFIPGHVLDPFEDNGLGRLNGVNVGVDNSEQLNNAAAVLQAMGSELNLAEWQPEHERLS